MKENVNSLSYNLNEARKTTNKRRQYKVIVLLIIALLYC